MLELNSKIIDGIILPHLLEFPSMPKMCLCPPWDNTRNKVWAVKHTWSCSSNVIAVWTRTAPDSHGSTIPADPGRKNPADKICKNRLSLKKNSIDYFNFGKEHKFQKI